MTINYIVYFNKIANVPVGGILFDVLDKGRATANKFLIYTVISLEQ